MSLIAHHFNSKKKINPSKRKHTNIFIFCIYPYIWTKEDGHISSKMKEMEIGQKIYIVRVMQIAFKFLMDIPAHYIYI